jgi:ubiquinone/menaquinone biosynthesis C-methylase UbiE
VITEALFRAVACPVCLQPAGCAACAREGPHGTTCASYGQRIACACGGPEKVSLVREAEGLRCPCCRDTYPVREAHLDLRPREAVGEITRYADHEFFERLNVTDAPPVLSARVKADMMRRMLAPAAGEAVLDLGCGAGKMALYAAAHGHRTAGVDLAPFFLARATTHVELVLGDLRRLPFKKGAFTRAYSLDVLEHLDETGVREILREACRTVGPAGRLFVYTHAMESSRLAGFQRFVNRLARRLGQRGLIDHEREALRKSDHRNAIRSHEHFEALCQDAGLEVAERRYYNVVFKAIVEDLGLRLYEQARRRKGGGAPGHGHAHAHDHGHDHPGAAPVAPVEGAVVGGARPGRVALALAEALTWLLKLDVVLFGGIRTGPFFGLLRPRGPR